MKKKLNSELFYLSFLSLFLELVLIRWIGSEIRIFAYLKNYVLIACFLGVGVGCFQFRLNFKPLHSLFILAALVFSVTTLDKFTPFSLKQITLLAGEALSNKANFWYYTSSEYSVLAKMIFLSVAVILILFLFFMVAVIFVPFGRRLGKLFDEHPNTVQAYSANILGSMAGSLALVLLSYWESAPYVWFSLCVAMTFYYFRTIKHILVGAITSLAIIAMLWQSDQIREKTVFWSPYQKLVLWSQLPYGYQMDVNNAAYQCLLNLSYDFIASHPEKLSLEESRFGHYEMPYLFTDRAASVLIVGGGAGNDAASAIRHGVSEIDCVEIDPTIISIGKKFHPEKPYQNANVNVINDDARAYFQKTNKKYDLIWCGLADSHTVQSSYTNVRLDHFLYTRESMQKVKSLLKDDGILVLIFEVSQSNWVGERLYRLLSDTFGKEPLAFKIRSPNGRYGFGGTVYVTGNADIPARLNKLPVDFQNLIQNNRVQGLSNVHLTTDDWPFLYLERPGIPPLYFMVSLSIILCFMLLRRTTFKASMPVDWKFLFMGAGFMLLEVQAITQAGLLFGSTWVVNSFIITQILIWILLSNWAYARWKWKNTTVFFFTLVVSLALLWVVPMDFFRAMELVPRAIFSSLFLTMPIFSSGILFIDLFSRARRKNEAIGSNLFGALIGGLLEALSLAVGFKALLIPTAIIYALVFFAMNAGRRRSA